jgi:hypothetical protein
MRRPRKTLRGLFAALHKRLEQNRVDIAAINGDSEPCRRPHRHPPSHTGVFSELQSLRSPEPDSLLWVRSAVVMPLYCANRPNIWTYPRTLMSIMIERNRQ